MRKKNVGAGLAPVLLVMCLLTTFTIIITACSSGSPAVTEPTPTPPTEPNTVLLEDHTFNPPSITIKKGESLTLRSDTSAFHIIRNGTWDASGTKKDVREDGAPLVDVPMNSGDKQSFTFNVGGNFHLYCPLHSDMNLTVIVT